MALSSGHAIIVHPVFSYQNLYSEISNSYSKVLDILSSKISHLSMVDSNAHNKNSLFTFQSSEDAHFFEDSVWATSTLKRRRSKMNKHKLRKRRKLLQKNTKISRGK